MLPQAEPEATVVVCEDDEPTLELLCDHLEADRFRPCRRLCRGRPSPLPLQAARPAAPRPAPARRLGARRAARDPRLDGATGPLRPGPPGDRPQRPRPDADRVRGFAEGATTTSSSPSTTRRSRRGSSRAAPPRLGREGPRRMGEFFIDPRGARCGSAIAPSSSRTRSSRCCARWRPSRTASSPRRSCFATCGAFAPWVARARSTPTPAGCGASSTPRRALRHQLLGSGLPPYRRLSR